MPRERVVPERIVKPDGPGLPATSSRPSPRPRLGEILFQLVADRLDGTPDADLRAGSHRPGSATRPAASVDEHLRHLHQGDVLVEQGQAIGEEQLILLRLEHEAAIAT